MNGNTRINKAARYVTGIVTAALILVTMIPAAGAAAPLLKAGSTGDAVTALQNRLLTLGYMDYSVATGYFGVVTKTAVVRFQAAHGLGADGIAGPATNSVLYNSQARTLMLNTGSRGEPVTALQARLRDLGYTSADNVTGYYGPITKSAVSAFQRSNGLGADGIAGPLTRAKLFSDGATRAQSSPSSAESIADIALSSVGRPYALGGNGPSYFDCSGLAYYSMTNAGFRVSRLSASAYSENTAWPKITGTSSLKKGDLLFFRSDTSSYISHMGIYTGGGQFVHASSGQRVVMTSSLDNSYWARNFVFARRVA